MTTALLSMIALLFSSIALPQFASILPQQEAGENASCVYMSWVTLLNNPLDDVSIKVSAQFNLMQGMRRTTSPRSFSDKIIATPNGAVITPAFVESIAQKYTAAANMVTLTGFPACSPRYLPLPWSRSIVYPGPNCYGGVPAGNNTCSSCGNGYERTAAGTCVPTTTCPAGQTRQNGQCVRTFCPAGQTLVNGVCTRPVLCTDGKEVNADNACVCPAATNITLPNGQCVRKATCPANATVDAHNRCVCTQGYAMNANGSCVVQTFCPWSQLRLNGVCVIRANCYGGDYVQATNTCSTCGTGYTRTAAGTCTETVCPAGQTLLPDGKTCAVKADCHGGTYFSYTNECANCGTGYLWSAAEKTCTACPAGQVALQAQCVVKANCYGGTYFPFNNTCSTCGTGYTRQTNGTCAPTVCPAGKTLVNGVCVAIESGGCIFKSHIAIGNNGNENASIALRGVRFTIFRAGNAGSTDTYSESPKSFYNKIVPTPDGGEVTRGFLDFLIQRYTDPKNMPSLTGLPACTSPAFQALVWNSIYPPIPCTDGKILLNQMCVLKTDCRGGAYIPATNTCSTCGTGYTRTADGRCTETVCPANQTWINGQCVLKTNCFGGTYVPATNTCGNCGTGYMRTAAGTCVPMVCPAGKTLMNGECVTPDCSALAYREGGADYSAQTLSVTNTNATCGCYYQEYMRYATIRYQDLDRCPAYEQQRNGDQGGGGGYGGPTTCATPRMMQNGACACPPAAPVYEAATNVCHAACAAPRSFWNGQQCACPVGKVWDQPTQTCHVPCDSPLSWNGQQCACPKESNFNKQTNTCDPVTDKTTMEITDTNDDGNNNPLCTLPLVSSKGGCVNPLERCTAVGRLLVIPSPGVGGMKFIFGISYRSYLPLDATGGTSTATSNISIAGPFLQNSTGIPAGRAAVTAAINSFKAGAGAPHPLCTSYSVMPYKSFTDLSRLAYPWLPE